MEAGAWQPALASVVDGSDGMGWGAAGADSGKYSQSLITVQRASPVSALPEPDVRARHGARASGRLRVADVASGNTKEHAYNAKRAIARPSPRGASTGNYGL